MRSEITTQVQPSAETDDLELLYNRTTLVADLRAVCRGQKTAFRVSGDGSDAVMVMWALIPGPPTKKVQR